MLKLLRKNKFLLTSLFGVFLMFIISYSNGKGLAVVSEKNTNSNTADKSQAVVAVAPHHALARDMVEELFDSLKDRKFETVFLISPNHFKTGAGYLQTSDGQFETSFGKIETNHEVIKALEKSGLVRLEKESFQGEHGIDNITPYIREYLPTAHLVPLLIADKTDDAKIDILADLILKNADKNSLILLSADFSHYLSAPAASFHDEFSKAILTNKDYKKAVRADIDCPGGLRLILEIAQKERLNFKLTGNSNAAIFSKDNFVVEPTSYVAGYFDSRNEDVEKNVLNLSFFGDLMLDRSVRTHIAKNDVGSLFVNSERIFLGADQEVANLEGVLADYESVSVGTTSEEGAHFKFVFNPDSLDYFRAHGFGIFNLGNNHTKNFGDIGVKKTVASLKQDGIAYFGQPGVADGYLTREENGVRYALINYNQFESGSDMKTLRQISDLQKTNDVVVVYAHWGEEYADRPNEKQVALAHKFIDAGVGAVIGSHPHVVESIEKYRDKYIFYSLGNFVFDQFFSENTQRGLNLGMSYDKNDKTFSWFLVPFEMKHDFKWEVLQGGKLKAELARIAELSDVSEREKMRIKAGIL